MPPVHFDQSKRQIHASGHTGRGPHIPVAHKDRVAVDGDLRIALFKDGAPPPMRAGTFAIQQSGFGQDHRPRANRHNPAGTRRSPTDIVEQQIIFERRGRAVPARDDQCVNLGDILHGLRK